MDISVLNIDICIKWVKTQKGSHIEGGGRTTF